MPNPAIPRDLVHALAEACGEEGEAFKGTALRLAREQRRLTRWLERNFAGAGQALAGQVALYMLTVVLRVLERVGGRARKVTGRDIEAAMRRVEERLGALMPPDAGFAERARAVGDRAQPHVLDEVLWALYDREERAEDEAELDPEASALVYVALWTAVEALDRCWTPPADLADRLAALRAELGLGEE